MTERFPEIDGNQEFGMLIDDELVGSDGGHRFRLHDPFEDIAWGYVPEATVHDVNRAVAAAKMAFKTWSQTLPNQRAEILRNWARLLIDNLERIVRLQVHENGKTVAEVRATTVATAQLIEFTAQYAMTIHGVTVQPTSPHHQAWTQREPLGVVAAITPWNNPLLLLAWKLAPAVAAGNTVVIKPSEVTPASTLLLVQLARDAGLPRGVINVITGSGDVGRALVEHSDVSKVAFTGSTGTGAKIAEITAPRFVSTTLELGGKAPQIVYPDADLDRAAEGLLTGLIAGAGQACNAGSRMLLHARVYDEVLGRLNDLIDGVVIDDPLSPNTMMGPLASPAQYTRVIDFLRSATTDQSVDLIRGGRSGKDLDALEHGLFVEPTLFATPDPNSRIRREEIFGPVGAVIRFTDEAESVRIANETSYGLVSGLWTRDISRAHRVAAQLRTGVVWINTWRAFSLNVPFGGRKLSGIGRELGLDMFDEYTDVKSIWLGTTPEDDSH